MNKYHFNDIYTGLTESLTTTITAQMMKTFQNICGDTNPLHTDISYALKKGFSGKVVFGMLYSSLYSTLVGVHLPGKYCLMQGIKITFKQPVYIGDTLMVVGEVSFINEAYHTIDVKATIRNQHKAIISRAKIQVGFI